MAQESQVANRVVTSTNIPYRSNISPLESDPCYVTGSQEIMTSINGYAERRPGFSANVETTPTTFNNLFRLFTWERFDGTFIDMACDINSSSNAVVYKRVRGLDNSFSSIFTDTGSSTPFDFVVSNNTVYFSNGNTAKKYDPTNGLSNWGIAVGSINTATGPNIVGSGTNSAFGGTAWTNPSNITANDGNRATLALTGFGISDKLLGETLGFAISSTSTIKGILVELKNCITDQSGVDFSYVVQLLKNGSIVGDARGLNFTSTGSGIDLSSGSSSDLWNTTWVPNDINQTTFGVAIYATNLNVSAWNSGIDYVQITIYSLGGPAISVSGSAGTFSATIGYQYVFCYGNSNTGHISSPSPASSSTGVFTNKLNVQVSLTASTDAQVNQIHVYRSTDSVATGSNAGVFFELPTSPYTNTTANITDNAADTSLNILSVAPLFNANDPPTPLQCPVYFAGRIWGLKNNQVVFSSLEECITGVPEESFPSGLAGNFWNFDQPVQALSVVGNGVNQELAVFCPGRIYGISGTDLETFRRFLKSDRRGARNIQSVSSIGGVVAWRDTSGQVWLDNGNEMQELSIDIRPDLTPYTPGTDAITFHSSGRFHWLVVSTGTKLFVFDFDLGQWMPPWNITTNNIYSGETSAGSYNLMAATAAKAIQMSPAGTAGTYNDNGTTYQMIANTQLFSMVPDYGKRFSYASLGIYNEPGKTGYLTRIQVDTNNNTLGDVLVCVDDDPTNASTVYTSVFDKIQTPQVVYNRGQGINLIQSIFPLNKEAEGRWFGLKIESKNADDTMKIYDFFASYKGVGGR